MEAEGVTIVEVTTSGDLQLDDALVEVVEYDDARGVQLRVTWRWRATRSAAKLPHARLHDLRHFYASGLIAAGCDVVTVQRALGHSTATTTPNTYSHLWPTAEDRTRSAAADLMSEVLRHQDGETSIGHEAVASRDAGTQERPHR